VVAGGRVFIGSNNTKPLDPEIKGWRGTLLCFAAANGAFLWQAVHEKLYPDDKKKAVAYDSPVVGICSTPAVAGNRVYYISNRGELVCADVEGFHDGENDGPFTAEKSSRKQDADFVWILDMRKELGVSPHQASASCPLVVGDLVFAVTGHGRDEQSGKIESPKAPSFIAVEAKTGKVVWQSDAPGDRILTGQWGSPAYGVVDGQAQVVFPGGDRWLYAFEPATGKPLWKFDCGAHEKTKDDGKPETENQLVATPVFVDGRVFIGFGEHPDVGGSDSPGCLRVIDARKRGDITKTGEIWRIDGANFERTIANVAVLGGVVYAVESTGYLNCIDLHSGRLIWRHDFLTTIFGSPLVADGKVYVRTGDGEVVVFAANKKFKIVARNKGLSDLGHGTLVAADGVLYVAGNVRLYAIAQDK
jgi:outer membrane protein assembly factor BamB